MERIHIRTIQKDLNDLDNHDGVVSHSESDILECKIKWALWHTAANKASGGDGIPAKLFKILSADEWIRKPSSVINEKKQENSRMGKTRDLFKKIRDSKGTFHAKMGKIKDRNGMDLTEAEDIKKRWQEYT